MAVPVFNPASVGMLMPLLVGAISCDCQAEGVEAKICQVVITVVELQRAKNIGDSKRGSVKEGCLFLGGEQQLRRAAFSIHAKTCRKGKRQSIRHPCGRSTLFFQQRAYRTSAVSQHRSER